MACMHHCIGAMPTERNMQHVHKSPNWEELLYECMMPLTTRATSTSHGQHRGGQQRLLVAVARAPCAGLSAYRIPRSKLRGQAAAQKAKAQATVKG
eukprot:364496-Chlamydomonas_euryale.AAC.37